MIQSSERRWALGLGVALGLLTTLPYLIGFAVQGQNWHYTGLLIASEDGNSYLAKMALGAAGDWLFRTPYTPTAQQGFLAFLPYILLGKLAAPPGQYEQLVVLFHLFRVTGTVFLALATYRFVSLFLGEVSQRRLAALVALLGGGLGFLAPFGLSGWWQGVMKLPLEFYSPETFGFLSPLAFPHLAWARAFLLLGMVFYLVGLAEPGWRSVVKTGLAWLGIGFMQPLSVVTAWAVVGVYLLVLAALIYFRKETVWAQWRRAFWRACLAGLISSPLVLYNFLSFQLDPFLKRWQAQNIITSPPPGDYLLAYLFVIPLLIWGCLRSRQLSIQAAALPVAWLVAFPFLAYAPYNLQRRLPEGIWVALSVLAVLSISTLPQRWRKAATAWLCLGFLSSLFLYVGGLTAVLRPQPPLFRPAQEVKAMNFFAAQAHKGDVVLAAFDTSNVLPTRAPVKVLIGHGPESLGLAEIRPRVEAFYRTSTAESQRSDLLKQFGVKYVFRGPLERNLGDWDPAGSPNLHLVYSDGGYDIYEVKLPQ